MTLRVDLTLIGRVDVGLTSHSQVHARLGVIQTWQPVIQIMS